MVYIFCGPKLPWSSPCWRFCQFMCPHVIHSLCFPPFSWQGLSHWFVFLCMNLLLSLFHWLLGDKPFFLASSAGIPKKCLGAINRRRAWTLGCLGEPWPTLGMATLVPNRLCKEEKSGEWTHLMQWRDHFFLAREDGTPHSFAFLQHCIHSGCIGFAFLNVVVIGVVVGVVTMVLASSNVWAGFGFGAWLHEKCYLWTLVEPISRLGFDNVWKWGLGVHESCFDF